MAKSSSALSRRALRIEQASKHPLFMFALTGDEILKIADVSRVSRDSAGQLIGYQRPEVRRHVQDIVDYLNTESVLFPNSIIMALCSDVRFRSSRGPKVSDGLATSGTLEIPLEAGHGLKPGWLVDGQQRALALSKSKRKDLPVPVCAFVADEVMLQRDQFLRVNNTKPLPRGLVTELLPAVSTLLPRKLAAKKIPSELCDLLNRDDASPFYGLISRASSSKAERRRAVVADSSIVRALEESLTSPSGCLFPYRNIATGETDFDGIWSALLLYWDAVRETFPEAWGIPPTKSRLMHGAGIRAMGRLMDKALSTLNPKAEGAAEHIRSDLQLVAPHCRWTEGVWGDIGMPWDGLQNVSKHINLLSSFLIRTYTHAKMAA